MGDFAKYIQSAPQTPNYTATPIAVPAHLVSSEKAMSSVVGQQRELNMVNNLTGGGYRRKNRKSVNKKQKRPSRRNYIRTYKGRLYIEQHGGEPDGQIVIPTASGSGAGGAQNAMLTATLNQAKSNAINDAYVGGRRWHRYGYGRSRNWKKFTRVRNTHRKNHSLLSRVVYKIKNILRK